MVLVFVCITLRCFKLYNHLAGKDRASCFTLIECDFWYVLSPSHGA